MNNTTFCSVASCAQLRTEIRNVVYFYLSPAFTAFGLTGHSLMFYTLLRQAKNQNAYLYQLLVVGNEAVLRLMATLYCAGWVWLMPYNWFQECWFCMWYTVHMCTFIVNWFSFNVCLMTLVITVDRSFALWKPFSYRAIDHRKLQKIIAVSGLLLSFIVSVYDCGRFELIRNGDSYQFQVDDAYVGSTLAIVCSAMQSVLRVSTGVLLVIFSVLMVCLYKRYTNNTLLLANENRKARMNETVLIMLTSSQCLFSFIQLVSISAFYSIRYSSLPATCPCITDIGTGILDGIMQSSDLAKFYFCLFVSPDFRKMIVSALWTIIGKHRSNTIRSINESRDQRRTQSSKNHNQLVVETSAVV